jgi:5-hydroxyisourate hydrolase
MTTITTHVLDTSRGRPAAGIPITLERQAGGEQWQTIGEGETDADGRLRSLTSGAATLPPGLYRLVFDVAGYFTAHGAPAFYPTVVVVFETAEGEQHYHVPLLLSPFGYSTYRGS